MSANHLRYLAVFVFFSASLVGQNAYAAACPQLIDSNDCVANDLQPTGLELINAPEACTEGQLISVTARVMFENGGGAAERYNVGFYVGDDGNPVIGGDSCTFDSLQPIAPPLDLTGGSGGFRELNGDACGDIARREPTYKDIESDRILCKDNDGDGQVDVSYVLTWVNNANQANCRDPLDPAEFIPNPPKCLSDIELDIPITVEPAPSIEVIKVASPAALPAPGGPVVYSFTILNTSPAATDPVTIGAIVDTPWGDLTDLTTCTLPFVLAPGERRRCDWTTDVTGSPGDIIDDTVTVSGADDEGEPVEDSDSASVELTDPVEPPPPGDLRLRKLVSPASVSEPGGTVRYTVGVFNASTTPVQLTSLTDDLYGDLDGKGNCSVPQFLSGLSSLYVCSFEESVSGQPGDVVTDTITATGVDNLPQPSILVAEDSASVTITNLRSDIEVVKVATPESVPEPGGTVTFSLSVQNLSATDVVTINSLLDSELGVPRGTCRVPFSLAPGGDSFQCSYSGFVSGSGGDIVTNVVLATGLDDDDQLVADAGAASVFVSGTDPSIEVSKTALPAEVPESGGDVTYVVSIQNTSGPSDPVTLTRLTDEVNGVVTDLDGLGDCDLQGSNGGRVLPPAPDSGSLYTCSFTVTNVTGTAGTSLTDTVTANGEDDEGTPVSGSAQASVDFVAQPPAAGPDLRLVKFASPRTLPEPGDLVTYTVTLINGVGGTDAVDGLTVDALDDDLYGSLDGKGSCALPITLAPGGIATCSFEEFVRGNAGDVVTDTITASAVNGNGARTSASDDASVTLEDLLPTIEVVKLATPTTVPEPGGDVEFRIEVFNTSPGDVLQLDSLVDNVYGDLVAQGLCPTPGRLFPFREPYRCSFTTFVGGEPGFEERNTVIAVASDDDGNTAEGNAQAVVLVADEPARISMLKTATPRTLVAPGGDVTFDYVVSNDSNTDVVTLHTLRDTDLGELSGQGDCATPQTLGPGDTYSCAVTVSLTGEPDETYYNAALASGTSDDGDSVAANAAAIVLFTSDPIPPVVAPREVPVTGRIGLAALIALVAWLGLLFARGRR